MIHPATQQVRSSQPYISATNRPSEEEERIKENNDVRVRLFIDQKYNVLLHQNNRLSRQGISIIVTF